VALLVSSFPDDVITFIAGNAGGSLWSSSVTLSDPDSYSDEPTLVMTPSGERTVAGWSQYDELLGSIGLFVESADSGATWSKPSIIREYRPDYVGWPRSEPRLALSDAGATLVWQRLGPLHREIRARRAIESLTIFNSSFED